MKEQTIIGIDNGLSGGLCAINNKNEILGIAKMPCKPYGYKNEIDPVKVLEWVQQFPNPVVAIEEPLHFAPTLASMRSMALSFGKVVGSCNVKQVPCIRVQVKDWQDKVLGKGLRKGLTKIVALRIATARWPKQKWSIGSAKVPHDGIIDAALIATYANENSIPEPVKPKRRAPIARTKKVASTNRRAK